MITLSSFIKPEKWRLGERIVENLSLFSTPVLDVSCGTGRYMVKIAVKRIEVVALDLSWRMLLKRIEKATRLGVSNRVHPVVADGENLPFREEYFKGLVCALTIDYFENREKATWEFSSFLAKNHLCIVTILNNRVLNSYRRLHGLPRNTVDFRIRDLQRLIIYEEAIPLRDLKEVAKRHFEIVRVDGCFYCYLLPFRLARLYYRTGVEHLLSYFKPALKYAGVFLIILKRKRD